MPIMLRNFTRDFADFSISAYDIDDIVSFSGAGDYRINASVWGLLQRSL